MAVTQAQLEQLYLAYFGRPADFGGVAFYTANPDVTVDGVAASFGTSAESISLYGPNFGPSVINAIYQNLFNRDAEPAGMLYWTQVVAQGWLTPAGAALAILQGAQNADAVAIANKLAAADAFTNGLQSATDILGYSGDQAASVARTWLHSVTSDSATLTAALGDISDHSIYDAIDNVGGIAGQTVSLTANPDTFLSANQTYVDTINGIVDFTGAKDASTFSTADKITGNDHTVVNVILKDTTGGVGDFVTMSGINKLNFTNANTANADITFNGSSWTDVAQVTLNGAGGEKVIVDGMDNSALGNVKLVVDGATTGSIELTSAAVGSATVSGTIANTVANSVGAVASFGTSGIDVLLGKSGTANIGLIQSTTSSSGSVSVGDLTFGHYTVNVGAGAEVTSVWAYNQAVATGTSSAAHSATVGNVSFGNVDFTAASKASIWSYYNGNYADVNGYGNAKAGNLTMGNVTFTAGPSGSAYATFTNQAYADHGSATVGSVVVGNITLAGTGYDYLYVHNTASVATKGAATAGDVTVGNIVFAGTGGTNDHSLFLYNSATSHKGAATVGSTTLGSIDSVAGYYSDFYIYNSASARTSGAATAGNVTIGDVNLAATGTGSGTNYGSNYMFFENYAYAANGNATAGSFTVGNITMNVATGYNDMYVENYAYGEGTKAASASVGDITIGTVTMNNTPATNGGTNYLYVSNWASGAYNNAAASAGSVSVGDININVGGITATGAYNYVYVFNGAGDAATGVAGNVTIGNITANTGLSGYVYIAASDYAYGSTSGATGLVTVGNVAMHGSAGAEMYLYVTNSNDYVGNTGGINVGNVSMVGDSKAGTVWASIFNFANSGDTGAVSVGNVNMTAAEVYLSIYNESSAGKVGAMSVGNVSLKGDNASTWNYISNYAQGGSSGTLTVGNISLTAGSTQSVNLYVNNSSTTAAAGNVSLGNLSLAISEKDATVGASATEAQLDIHTDGNKGASGNITTGNITVSASGVTSKAAITAPMQAFVTVSSVDGTVTVGNITVTGGVKGASIVTDNLATLSTWLKLTSGASSITVGNVDYSGYASASTIDVHTFSGVGTIKASKGGSTIDDNKSANSIDLSANTTKADTLNFINSQSGVKDSGGVVTASQTALDTITGWATGDSMHIVDKTTLAVVGLGGDGSVVQNTPSQDFATFLTHAETQITVNGHSAYTAVIGGNTYVAMNVGGVVGQIVEVMGSHTFNIAADTAGYDLSFLT